MSEEIRFEQVSAKVAKQAAVEGCVKCGICSQKVEGLASVCAACETVYHGDCWGYHGGCAIYGCSQTPDPERPIAVEVRPPGRGRVRRAVVALGALSCLTFGMALGFSAGHTEGWRAAEAEVERQDALSDALDEAIDEAELLAQLAVTPIHVRIAPGQPGASFCKVHGGSCVPDPRAAVFPGMPAVRMPGVPSMPAPGMPPMPVMPGVLMPGMPMAGMPIAGAVPGARVGPGPVGVGAPAQVVVDSALLEVEEKAADELGLVEGKGRASTHELQSRLMALEDEGRADLVASPRLMSEDGREATLTMGDRGRDEAGNVVESSVALTVRPEIAGDVVRLHAKLAVTRGAERIAHDLVIEAHDGQEMVSAVVPAAGGKRLVILLTPHVMRGEP